MGSLMKFWESVCVSVCLCVCVSVCLCVCCERGCLGSIGFSRRLLKTLRGNGLGSVAH